MRKVNLHTRDNQRRINPDWFTAKTRMKEIGDALQVSEQKIYHVHFENGSKTKLHMHNGSQILIVTGGKGSLQFFKRLGAKSGGFDIKRTESTPLKDGDVVYIPARTLHTHGSADKGTAFSHVAINIPPRRNAEYVTTWYESDFRGRVSGIIK